MDEAIWHIQLLIIIKKNNSSSDSPTQMMTG